MSHDIDKVIEQHLNDLMKIKIELFFLTRKTIQLNDSISFLQSLKYDMFLSHEMMNIDVPEDDQSYPLYEEVNQAYADFKERFDEFQSKQTNMQWVAQLNKRKKEDRQS